MTYFSLDELKHLLHWAKLLQEDWGPEMDEDFHLLKRKIGRMVGMWRRKRDEDQKLGNPRENKLYEIAKSDHLYGDNCCAKPKFTWQVLNDMKRVQFSVFCACKYNRHWRAEYGGEYIEKI